MYHGGGGQQAVHHRNWARGGCPSPSIRHLSVYADYPARELFNNRLQPCFQCFCLVDVATSAGKLNAPANLADGERAYEEL